MATGGRSGPDPQGLESAGATEPITLNDPDGSITRVAPWSAWTREQIRAPGGEAALVTRLDQGQLWFSAGRRRSPWRHEVHVGPAVASTPKGRFQAVAEADGGATVTCLAGRTRVVAGLREPVLLGPDQSVAVSSDGGTLVVMDRAVEDDGDASAAAPAAGAAALVAADAGDPRAEDPSGPGQTDVAASTGGGTEDDVAVELPPRPARFGWVPELVAVAALVALLVAAVWVFGRSLDDDDTATAPSTTEATTTSEATTTTTEAPTTTTEAPTTTAAPTTQTTPPAAAAATATASLQSCRRAAGGVDVTATVRHGSGPASAFTVTAALVDGQGQEFARGQNDSETVEPGGTIDVVVRVSFEGTAQGTCEVRGVTAV